MTLRKVPHDRNPFNSGLAGPSRITLATEASDAIVATITAKAARSRSSGVAGMRLKFWLSDVATGIGLTDVPPSGGIWQGTNGILIPGADHMRDGLIAKATLAIHGTPEDFQTTTTATFRINGAIYTKAAAAVTAFSAAHVVAAGKYGIVLVMVNSSGTVSTKVPGATQTTPMAYNTAALALAALPHCDQGKAALGYITLDNSGSDGSSSGAWVANTDDMTNGSDITVAAFVDATERIGPVTGEVITSSAGVANLEIIHSGAKTCYLNVQFPDGSVLTKQVVFAA